MDRPSHSPVTTFFILEKSPILAKKQRFYRIVTIPSCAHPFPSVPKKFVNIHREIIIDIIQ